MLKLTAQRWLNKTEKIKTHINQIFQHHSDKGHFLRDTSETDTQKTTTTMF